MRDQVILVDDHDRKLGVMDKVEAHRGKGRRHRAISVFLFDDHGRLLIQQRSRKKIVGAGQWANTCCGNVRPGETRRQCAYRRLKEELGIKGASVSKVGQFVYQAACNEEFSESEVDGIYVGVGRPQVILNLDEVSAVGWLPWTEFKEQVNQYPSKFAPWVGLILKEMEIVNAIENRRERYVGTKN